MNDETSVVRDQRSVLEKKVVHLEQVLHYITEQVRYAQSINHDIIQQLSYQQNTKEEK